MKLLVTTIFIAVYVLATGSFVYAATNSDKPFELIPEAKDSGYGSKVDVIGDPNASYKGKRGVRDKYNQVGDDYTSSKDLGAQIASGVITWDTILLLLTQVVKFIANAALVVGALMVIYAWYLYASSAFAGDSTGKAQQAIKDAAIGIVIVIFSYAIQRVVTQAFLS